MADGAIESTFRWRTQIQGAHAGSNNKDYNERGIGICLVGNFEKSPPTPAQKRSIKLLEHVRNMPVQARGRTKVSTNLRVLPGRTEPRLYQFARNVPVEIVGRGVAEWVQSADEKDSGNDAETKKEDWFLVRGIASRPPGESSARVSVAITTTEPGDQTVPIAGWVIARFIELDLPDPVREGASSANIRPVAWFELNRAPDPSGDKPQYLLAATRGPEGQPCD